MPRKITSTANPQIKALARLKDRRGRVEAGRFLIEGHRELERAAASITIDEVLLAPGLAGERERALADRLAAQGVPVLEVGDAAFARISMRGHPDGLLGVAALSPATLDDLALPDTPLVLVLDGIEKPGNLGAIVRTADGAGVDAMIVTNGSVEPTNPNAIRASQGAVFALPIVVAGVAAVQEWIVRHRLRVIAASPESSRSLWQADFTGGTAVVIGAEAEGVSPAFRSPDTTVRIPMAGIGDSLNASVAAAIMLYEAVRQRS